MGMLGLALSDIAMYLRMMAPPTGVFEPLVLLIGLTGGAIGYISWFAWQVATVKRRAGAVGDGVLLDGTILGVAAAAVFAVLVVAPQADGTSLQVDQVWLLGCLVADIVLVWLSVPILTTRPSRRTGLVTVGLLAHVGFDLTHALSLGAEMGVAPSTTRMRLGELLVLAAFGCWFLSFRTSDATELSSNAVARTAHIRAGGLVAALTVPVFLGANMLWSTSPGLTGFLLALGLTLSALVAMRVRNLVSDMAAMQAELAHRADHDHLTGVWNRAALIDYVDQLAKDDSLRAVLYIDLDGFKAVNDTLGHDAGDHVLVTVADRLSHAVRGSDRVARIGGDEFVVVVTDADTDVQGIVDRLTSVLNREPIHWEGGPLKVGASIGLARRPTPSGAIGGNETTAPSNVELYDLLLGEADAAMFAQKAARKTERVQTPRESVTASRR